MDRMPGGRRLRPYAIAGIPYPERTETQHTIVSGTTGSGKTVLISDLVAQIRARGERCVLYDKMGSYTATFFDPARDVLMNPLDARAPGWSPFLEARNPRDFDMMAAALIPQQKDTVDPFWVTAARQLFANGAGRAAREGSHGQQGSGRPPAQDRPDGACPGDGGDGRAVHRRSGEPEDGAFGARHAHRQSRRLRVPAGRGRALLHPGMDLPGEGDGFLFLTSRGDQHASLRGLISTWLEIAVNAMLSLAQDDGRRIWVILDELPTLHQVPSLQPGLAESRQFGGCFVLGVQVASALRDLYGRNGAETISGLCGTRVVLAAPDRDTAQWSADSLGRSEVEEVTEGYSYGANTIRDGVSLTPRRELRALALPSEIMRLANLEGYLKFPGPFPVASIRLKYVARPARAERFVPRPEGMGAASADNAAVGTGAARTGDSGLAIPDPAERAEPAPDSAPQSDGRAADSDGVQGELPLLPTPPGKTAAGEAGADDPANRAAAEGEDRKPDEVLMAVPRDEDGGGSTEPESSAAEGGKAGGGSAVTNRPDWG